MKHIRSYAALLILLLILGCKKDDEGDNTAFNDASLVVMTNIDDSQLLSATDDENNVIEVFGQRNQNGLPTQIDQLIIRNQQQEEQIYILDDLGRPTEIIANNGTQFQLNWLSESTFALTVLSIDGQNQINTVVDLEDPGNRNLSFNGSHNFTTRKGSLGFELLEKKTALKGGKQQGNLILNVNGCGQPTEVSNPRIIVKSESGTLLRTIFPERVGTGVFETTLPSNLTDPITGNEICQTLESLLGNICIGYSIGIAAYGPLLCAAVTSAVAATGVGSVVAVPIFEACTAVVAGLELYCATLGASPVNGAPSLASKICEAELLNFSFDDEIQYNGIILGLPNNIISSTITAPGEGPYPNINMSVGNNTLISGFSILPAAPQDGQDYNAIGSLFCLKTGDIINLSVVGTDGYMDEINFTVPSDMAEGDYILSVPGAETGVRDVCTLEVLSDANQNLIRTTSIVFGN